MGGGEQCPLWVILHIGAAFAKVRFADVSGGDAVLPVDIRRNAGGGYVKLKIAMALPEPRKPTVAEEVIAEKGRIEERVLHKGPLPERRDGRL